MAQRDDGALNALMGFTFAAMGGVVVASGSRVPDEAFWGVVVGVMMMEFLAFQLGKQVERERQED